jgi:hypothetical protein
MEMKRIPQGEPSYDAILKSMRKGQFQQLASASSLKYGYAELVQIGYGKSEEYAIVAHRVGDEMPGVWYGGRAETKKTWHVLAKHIAMTAP